MRRWRGALGLRGRIVGVVLVTTVTTLIVAAVAVLGPLEHELKNKALSTLRAGLREKNVLAGFRSIDPPLLYYLAIPSLSGDAQDEARHLQTVKDQLASRFGVAPPQIVLLGYADGRVNVIPHPRDSDFVVNDNFSDGLMVFRTSHSQFGFTTINGTEYARAAVPVLTADKAQPFVVAVRKPISDIPAAVNVIRTAFLDAALAGLALTMLLAIPLSARLVRRLRELRHAALESAQAGRPVPVPVDRVRDEVGDLSQAFATMQRRLIQQEQARRAFVATASHELRTPLTSLEGMLELLDDDLHGPHPDIDDARALLERARVQSHRLARLAADLLDLSRIDAEVELRSEPIELSELARAVMAEFELGVAERGLRLGLDDPGGAVWVHGDPGSIARILRILVENAVRVSPDGGTVTVSVRTDPAAVLTVSDEGPGVDPAERELIFERFHRGRETGGQAGFGLGLAIGRELAERMHGALSLRDTDPRGGACFVLTLPLTAAPTLDPLAVS